MMLLPEYNEIGRIITVQLPAQEAIDAQQF